MNARPANLRRASVAAGLILFAAASLTAAKAPSIRSVPATTPIRLDGNPDEWTNVPRVVDPKSGAEIAFQNDGRDLYVLVVLKKPEPVESAEVAGMSILGRPAGSRKPAKGALFLTRETSADGYIVWRESRGAMLTDRDKAEIRKTPRHRIFLAYAVDEKGSAYGPLRKQTEVLPPDFGMERRDGEAVYEFRLPLASPDLTPGGLGGAPGAALRVSFVWGGRSRKSLSTEAGSKASSTTGSTDYLSGTGRTWGQEYLDSFDQMSRPTLSAKKFTFAVDVALAGAREPGLFTNRGGPQMRGPRGEAVLLVLRIPENNADGAGSFRPEGQNGPIKNRE